MRRVVGLTPPFFFGRELVNCFILSITEPKLFELSQGQIVAGNINDAISGEDAIQSHYGPNTVMATVRKGGEVMEYKLSNVPVAEKLEKFMEDVK